MTEREATQQNTLYFLFAAPIAVLLVAALLSLERAAIIPMPAIELDLCAAALGSVACLLNIAAWARLWSYFVAKNSKTAGNWKNLLLVVVLKSTVVLLIVYGVFTANKIQVKSALLGFTVCLLFGSLFTALGRKRQSNQTSL